MQESPGHNSLWFLMARSLSGEATHEEDLQLRQILNGDVSLQQQYDLMKRMWSSGEKNYADDENERKHISKILQLAKQQSQASDEYEPVKMASKPKKLYYFSGAAAILILIIGFKVFSKTEEIPSADASVQSLTAQNGSRTRTILPDGSTVWLNAGSHLNFKENFSGKTREITLDGEAYFDVVKMPDKPFIVHVSGYDIKVLGTTFNVKSYPVDKTVETTLLRGLVQVTKHGVPKETPIFLHPNQKLILDKFTLPPLPDTQGTETTNTENKPEIFFLIKPIDSAVQEKERIETAWVYNRLQFRGESFADLALKLERWYNVKIVFEDDAVKQLNFNGSFENETIEQALYALKTATSFRFEIKENEILIRSF